MQFPGKGTLSKCMPPLHAAPSHTPASRTGLGMAISGTAHTLMLCVRTTRPEADMNAVAMPSAATAAPMLNSRNFSPCG